MHMEIRVSEPHGIVLSLEGVYSQGVDELLFVREQILIHMNARTGAHVGY